VRKARASFSIENRYLQKAYEIEQQTKNKMVKNTKGGNKGKKGARKNTGGMSHRGLRRAMEEGELYGVVEKVLGGGMCLVKCADGPMRQCVIRGKFRGRNKSANTVAMGVWVLVGLRDWEVRGSEEPKCDLLEVYSRGDLERLKQLESASKLPEGEDGKKEDDIFDRGDAADEEMRNEIVQELASGGGMGAAFLEADEEVDIDDI